MDSLDFDAVDLLGSGDLVFFVEGDPRPQPRPRMVGKGVKKTVVSTLDEKAQMWKRRVRKACSEAMQNRSGVSRTKLAGKLYGGVRIDMIFLFQTKDKARHGEFKLSVPDKDNLEKLVLDAFEMSGLFEKGDAQVCAGDVQKYWTCDRAGLMVKISRAENVFKENEGDAIKQRPQGLGF